jgi:hypothetical protein
MAKIMNGFPWNISGKLGDRVYYSRNGINYSRKLPVRKNPIISISMLSQQQKFSLLGKLFRPLTDLFRISFKKYTNRMSGYNKAFSCNIPNAFLGEYPVFTIDFNKLSLGDGYVANAKLIAVNSNGLGILMFTWIGIDRRGSARSKDHLYVAVYCEKINIWFYQTHAALRRDGLYKFDVSACTGNPVHVYVGFISAYENDASRSEYLGVVNV